MGLGFLQVCTVRSSAEFQMCLSRPLRSSAFLKDGLSQDSGKLEAEILGINPPTPPAHLCTHISPHLYEEGFLINAKSGSTARIF